MNKHLVILLIMLSLAGNSFAQAKKTATARKQPLFESWIKATNLPYEKINDSTVVIPFKGTVVASYQIFVVKTANLYVMLCNVSGLVPNIGDEKNFKRLLELNDELDIVKFSLLKDSGKIFARIDALDSIITPGTLGKLIGQLADAIDFAAQEFK
ncbi:MAG TPA: hypothetical protein VJ552_03420 [Sediminibacterium sp.]|nr:hypothetical protein [Sediminibacterium sp.]